jgi:Uma2 family endonuclease
MATVSTSRPVPIVLTGVSWPGYGRFLRAFAGQHAVRLTYDRGTLEIITISPEHELWKCFLGWLLTALAEEMNLPLAQTGSLTLRRRRKQRGLEPDQSYYIANESRVRGMKRLNLRRDPPPDLVVEVDITRSSLNRLVIYARLGVPELWRFDNGTLTFLQLQGKVYVPLTVSLSFPPITAAELTPFLALRGQQDETSIIRQFRAWLRSRLTPPATP